MKSTIKVLLASISVCLALIEIDIECGKQKQISTNEDDGKPISDLPSDYFRSGIGGGQMYHGLPTPIPTPVEDTEEYRSYYSKLSIQLNNFLGGRPFDGFVPRPPQSEYFLNNMDEHGVSKGFFTQKLDHFNSSEIRTWQQLYQMNDRNYRPGGPMFVMISGEAYADINWMVYGEWKSLAFLNHALMFQLEHRFYGQSQPTEDTSDKNLYYLTSEQALADLDAFIKSKMTERNISKVIVIGCSYGGSLATWYKAKYKTATGAIASSAPVMAKLDFSEYLETVGGVMEYFSPGCFSATEQGFTGLQHLVNTNNLNSIIKLFKPCDSQLNLSDPLDIAAFFESLIKPWMAAVQYSFADPALSQIPKMCSFLLNSQCGADPLHRLSALYKNLSSCIDHDYEKRISMLKNINWATYGVSNGLRQWVWQMCNEFGYFPSTSSTYQPFGDTVPLSYFIETYCVKTFGLSIYEVRTNTEKSNLKYPTFHELKNIILPYGFIDPWHNLGIYFDLKNSSGTCLCYDMFWFVPYDGLLRIIDVRNKIATQIGLWLQ